MNTMPPTDAGAPGVVLSFERKRGARPQVQPGPDDVVVVFVNGVEVGRITHAEWQDLRRRVRKDPRVWLHQAASLGSAAWTVVARVTAAIMQSMVMLWLAFCLLAPAEVSSVLQEMARSEEAVRTTTASMLLLAMVLVLLATAMGAIMGRTSLVVNHFASAVAWRLRMRFGVAADGVVGYEVETSSARDRNQR